MDARGVGPSLKFAIAGRHAPLAREDDRSALVTDNMLVLNALIVDYNG